MFNQNENKKMSLLPEEERKSAQEKISRIKGQVSDEPEEFYIPKKEVFERPKEIKLKTKLEKKPITEKPKKIEKKKSYKKGFWYNLMKGLRSMFNNESRVRKEKVVPTYNLPETKIVKDEHRPIIRLDAFNSSEAVFSKEEKPKGVFSEEEEEKEIPSEEVTEYFSTPVSLEEDFFEKIKKEEPKKETEEDEEEIELEDFIKDMDKEIEASEKDEEVKDEEPRLFNENKVKEEEEKKEKQKKESPKNAFSKPDYDVDEDAVEISLIPKTKKRLQAIFHQNLILILSWILVCLIFVGGFYWFLELKIETVRSQEVALENTKQELRAELNKKSVIQNKVRNLESKLSGAKDLLDQHIYWNNVFDMLESYTHSQVSYNGFSGSVDKVLTLKASAPNYAVAARQLLIFQSVKDVVSDVNVAKIDLRPGAEGQSSRVNFDIVLNLKPNIFKYK